MPKRLEAQKERRKREEAEYREAAAAQRKQLIEEMYQDFFGEPIQVARARMGIMKDPPLEDFW